MGCLTKTLGRLLFVTIIASSAYLHLSKPENYTQELSDNYGRFGLFFNEHITPGVIPPLQLINWTLWCKILGLFEGLIAILIVFGDCWGGFFLFLNLLVSGIFDYQDISTFVQWDVSRQLEFSRYVFFLGASLALMACTKKSCKTECSGKSQAESKVSTK